MSADSSGAPGTGGIGGMRAITVSRTYGSGGGEVAARLARRLGWRLFDHEMVVRVAHQLGLSEDEAVAQDERAESFISRALSSMLLAYPTVNDDVLPQMTDLDNTYHEALCRVIQSAADEGQAVIVGRGAFALLANRRDVLRVHIVAPLEQRVVYVARREGLDERAARDRINRKDRDRTRYVETRYHVRPNDAEHYDLTVNTAVLALDNAAELILLALRRKAERMSVPVAELGPAAGLPRYPGQPEDVPLPQNAEDARDQRKF
jgi:CMP/dCMP kinase